MEAYKELLRSRVLDLFLKLFLGDQGGDAVITRGSPRTKDTARFVSKLERLSDDIVRWKKANFYIVSCKQRGIRYN